MSRFGKLPVIMPEGVQIQLDGNRVVVKGSKGELSREFPKTVVVKQSDQGLIVEMKKETRQAKADQGTTRAHIGNMAKGVSEGWSRELEIIGTGYRAEMKGQDLNLIIGYSHPVLIKAPQGITFAIEKNKVTVSGIDKDVVGQTAALVRAVREPEPYKGKGIKYIDEIIRRKAGKQAAKTA